MAEETNYASATVFWLYNLAALVFTFVVVYTIVDLARRSDRASSLSDRHVRLFSTLAAVSFITLSANMLNVLVQSFLAWTETPYYRASDNLLVSIGRWSVTTTHFLDFGKAIVQDRPRYFWSMNEIVATFAVCIYMGSEGKQSR